MRTGKKIFFGLLTLLIALAFTEAGLRLFGERATEETRELNLVRPGDSAKLRILALGESTTADYFAEDTAGAWPRQLEARLNSAGIPARVYNEGLGGTSTPFILSRLSGYLETYRPHLVIGMMGINDYPSVYYDPGWLFRAELALRNLRLFKLVSWLESLYRYSAECDLVMGPIPPREAAFQKALALAKLGQTEAAEAGLRAAFPNDQDLALLLTEVSVRLKAGFSHRDPKLYAASAKLILRAYEIFPREHYVVFELIQTLSVDKSTSPATLEAIGKKLLACGPRINDVILQQLVYFHPWNKMVDRADVLRYWGLKSGGRAISATQFHYQIMAEELSRKGIALIAMQYPTVPVTGLKQYFADPTGAPDPRFGSVDFVENVENFRRARGQYSYDELFKDRFGGSWGHTTFLGHGLIAAAVAEKVNELVTKRDALASFRPGPGKIQTPTPR